MSFTKMSTNILEEPYASNYGNVYEKGALIGMCLDILMRKNSDGERGVLDLMKELTYQYGPHRPFEDSNLIPQITQLTYPEVGEFFTNHVIGTQPIQYKDFFDLVGLDYSTTLVDTGFLLGKQRPYINGNKEDNTIYILPGNLNTFLTALGVQGNDVITAVNGTAYDLSNVYDLITISNSWKVGDAITMTVQRNGEEITLSGTIITPQTLQATLVELQTYNDDLQRVLRKKWLKGS
jgi:predicted metalloprotease with PDZ domain